MIREMREFHRIIAEQARHMRGLIGDLLDAGRIDSGTLSVAPEPSELAGLVEAARSTFLGGGGRHPVLVDLSGEVRLARWDEIDLDAEVWTVLAERMKANHEHRVPLSCRATEILRTALTVRNGAKLLFPSPRGKPLSDMPLSKLLKEHGVQAVPHGFRCCSRPWRSRKSRREARVRAALRSTRFCATRNLSRGPVEPTSRCRATAWLHHALRRHTWRSHWHLVAERWRGIQTLG